MGIMLEFFTFSRWQISTGILFSKITLKENLSAENSTKKTFNGYHWGFRNCSTVIWCTYTTPWHWSQMTPCHAITPSGKKPLPCHSLSPSQWDGGRIWRVKVKKFMSWDKGISIGKAKAMQASETKQGINLPLPITRQMFSPPLESWAPSHFYSDLGRQNS